MEQSHKPSLADIDFDRNPFLVIWEVTRACDLKCLHCRAEAIPRRNPRELNHSEARTLLDQVSEFGRPLLVLTGGDPIRRPDVLDIIRYGTDRGLRVTMTPSATPLMTREVIARCREHGLMRLAVSLDGSTPAIHDAFRGFDGSYHSTMRIIEDAHRVDLPVQINTTVTKYNYADLDALVVLLERLDIVLWSVFFLVPTGRGQLADEVTARNYETIFHKLYDLSKRVPFDIKTTEAQHYRRVVIQRMRDELAGGDSRETELRARRAATPGLHLQRPGDGVGRASKGVNDGNGFVFISHTGEVYPSGFLPISGGNVRSTSVVEIYRHSPVFRQLRDYSLLSGDCGICDFRDVCGGSRARAFAVTGDYLASEPFCLYHPPGPEAAVTER